MTSHRSQLHYIALRCITLHACMHTHTHAHTNIVSRIKAAYYATLGYNMLNYATLCCAMLHYATLCHTMLHYATM